uniref:UTP6 small subunit processome component n=1 Tax=Gadus morhua TaxID=8049 RepID=A0A8C5B4I4_GADMO
MAEVIQLRVEERIPELEQLERVGLFTIVVHYKVIFLLESKKNPLTSTLLQYEINVLELVKKRREHIKYNFKREEIEFPIVQRINGVFKRATNKWKSDVQLWLSHIAFCKKWATKTHLSKVFSAMIAIHPDKSGLWIMAAKSELEDMNSSESARHLFLRALRFHPEDKKVFQEYFRMELLHAEKLRKQKSMAEEAEMDLVRRAKTLMHTLTVVNACNKVLFIKYTFPSPLGAEFIISLLNIAAIFDFTKELQDTILTDIQSKYTEDCVTWDFLARRELEKPSAGEELSTAKGRASDIARREERCSLVYEEGLQSLNTEPMFTCYAAFCLERHRRKTNVQELKDKREQRLQGVFQRAHDSSMLKEAFYKNWILLAAGDAEGVARVAMAATLRYSQSVSTWTLRLQMLMQLDSGDLKTLFKEALECISPKESLPVWRLQVQWSTGSQSPEETEALGVLSAVPAVAMEMKECYLDWSSATGGYKKARKTFVSLHESRPFSKTFFTKMIQIELEQVSIPDMSRQKRLDLINLFSHFNLWLGYIKEELGTRGQPENCGMLYWRAMKLLEGESVERFVSNYTLLQTGHL